MPAKGANHYPCVWVFPPLHATPGFRPKLITMKYGITALCLFLHLCTLAQEEKKFNDTAYLQPVEVLAIRAADKAPFAKTNLTQEEIRKNNLGADLPFLLNQAPSVVVNSDAGNGVGYTGIRIRGTDATRINMTINGIPYNDAESQGLFFVNLPDFASSVNSIQIQRGVGTSSNGPGAFGATLNLATNELNQQFYAELNNSAGSFNTWKNNFRVGSGLIGKHFTIDARLSRISSGGYMDRASTDLRSYYISTAWTDRKSSIRLNIFSGKEITYQAWYGVPESMLKTNRTFNPAGSEKPGNPYENEVDNYRQTHYQLFYNRQLNSYWKLNTAVFLTNGQGYYEQYKAGEDLADYGLLYYDNGNNIVRETDLIRRLGLDNRFYGTTFSLQHQKKNTQVTLGGGWNRYDGQHQGTVIWAQAQGAVPLNHRWYDLPALKRDFSLYAKWTEQWNPQWQGFLDIQYRDVRYRINGFRNNPGLAVSNHYSFINPKAGVTFTRGNWMVYASYALGSKEPNRDDFEVKGAQPRAEFLHDLELGLERRARRWSWSSNIYYMRYRDQLVLVGNINDVGAYTRTNIPRSFRLGLELQGKWEIHRSVLLSGNLTLSRNRILDYTELIDDYDNGGTKSNNYRSADIAFSPAVTGGGTLEIIPFKQASVSLIGKYVSRQYLDNTSQRSRSLNPYYVQDIRLSYQLTNKVFKSTDIILQLNNVFNKKYEANGYTFSYIYGGQTVTENYYFPMAPFNWMLGINIRI